ncbi:putative oxidoreductase virH [Fulvia fulva]|uniref:Oxidoreductase virH n=1 Tax=Passalora fulva TaxID=5499 RepID=A0A9Q8URX0_PASFU|nr:putative oxidoreductase virH [Fulvia fulva]KAK4619330.1 putative oxidoreductase virH [Fulvia fulva]KAK4620913.1 putative oxidoreductase virH [Fulvia fulva]UJO20170.1 putative oxidoreductase virH [Fulvia fulva]WPV17062.1 putative oxidoreductase virH [Fulvia fulva]WPV31910.1 putative oxidoreductase virH [Fulvia fulva]
MLSFLRAPHPQRTNNASKDLVIYENGTSSVHYHDKGHNNYMMTHTIPPTHPKEGPSIIQPPFHYHIYQTEKFHVQQGTANMYFGLNAKPSAVLSSKGGKSSAVLGPCRYHRFENASPSEVLKMDIQLDPEDYENEQRFFRNFFGYLDDCKRTKQAPSIFQLFVFLHSADTPLAIPLPNLPFMEMLGVYLSRLLLIAVAYFGMYGLGYQPTYPEYYDSNKSR